MRKTKISIDDIHDYLKNNWYDNHDDLTDFNMAIDSGFTEYAAYLIDSAGAIDPVNSFNPEVETAIKKLLKKYNPKRDIKDCFGKAVVFVNTKTNETAFVRNQYVDYLVTLSDFGPDWKVSE